jgi:hypothetical protein
MRLSLAPALGFSVLHLRSRKRERVSVPAPREEALPLPRT